MFSRSFLAASIAACSSFVFAAEATLPTTVVTATRTTQSVDDSLASVQVITKEQLAQHPSQDLGEILRFTTGIDVVRSGGFGGQTSIFTRGTESNHTLVLIDGVRINSATLSLANIQHLTLADVERVEIVKGAMSSLYGSEAIGGVINIITKTPNKTSSQATMNAGSHNLVNGSLTQTIKQGHFSAFINTNALYTDGYEIVDKNPRHHGYKNQGVDAKAAYDLGFSKVAINARQNKGHTEYDNYGTFATQDFENQLVTFSAQGDINPNFNSLIRLSQFEDKIDQNQSSNIAHTKRQEADWQNTIAISPNITIIAGITQTNTQAEYNKDYNKEQDNLAFYLQQQSEFGQISTQLSLRQEDYDSFGTHQTGNAALGFAITPQHRLYINYGTAFKAPDLTELYGSSGNINLKPEESSSVEIGSKHSFDMFSIKTAFFSTQIDNLVNSRPNGSKPNPFFDPSKPIAWPNVPTTTIYTNFNVDEAQSKGAELTVSLQNNGFFANMNGSYIKAQDKTSKKDLDRRPRRTLSMSTGYQTTQWGIGGEILAKGHTQDYAGRIAGYAVANVNAYWQVLPSTKLSLNLDNITDKTYSAAWADFGIRYLATPFTASISADVKF